MKRYDFYVPLYGYDVSLIQIQSKSDVNIIEKYLTEEGFGSEYINEVKEYVRGGYKNGGETNWNRRTKRICVLFYQCTSDEEKIEVYSHEKRHIEDRILEHCKVNDIEASAYLAGFLAKEFFKFDKCK